MADNEILIYGEIGFDVIAADIIKEIGRHKGRLTVRVNSYGGDVFAGIAIYNALRDHGDVRVIIDALAASAASLIACAGDTIAMRANAQMMIHDPTTAAYGNVDELRRSIEALTRIKDVMIESYVRRTGKDAKDIAAMMSKETWLSAQEALDQGFVDEILDDDEKALKIAARFKKIALPRQLMVAAARAGAEPGSPSAKEPRMTTDTQPADGPENDTPATNALQATANDNAKTDPKAIAAKAERAERARIAEIIDLCAGGFEDKTRDFVASGTSVREVKDTLFEALKRRGQPVVAPATVANDNTDPRLIANHMADAFAARFCGRECPDIKPTDAAKPYMAYGVSDMAKELLEARGERTRGQTKEQVFRAAMSTSDFPYMLATGANKILLEAYRQVPRSFLALARQRNLRDFKPVDVLRLGDFPSLEEKPEGADVKFGAVGETKETLRLKTYARGLAVTREMLINDDLNAFGDIAGMTGAAVARLENERFWNLITSNVTLSDGTALFSTTATRKNQSSTSDAISVDSIGKGLLAMRQQKSVDGNPIMVRPSFIVVPAAKEILVEQLLSNQIVPTQASNVVPGELRAGLTIIVEGLLDVASATAWYLFASPTDLPSFYYGYLEGQTGPIFDEDERRGVDVRYRLIHDFAVAAVDHRGVYRNLGA